MIFWYIAAGFVGGVLGGMGFGGGTLLIPILTFLLGVPYRLAAWVNLVAFIPMAIISLIVHCRNKMVEWRSASFLLLFALAGLAMGLFLSDKISEDIARRVFGIFLISIGSFSAFLVLVGYFKKNHNK